MALFNLMAQKRTVALYGGSFDPPHKGHKAVIEDIMTMDFVHELWIMPCGDRNDKSLLLSYQERLNMIQQFLPKPSQQRVVVKVTDEEIKLSHERKRMIRTVELLEHLRDKYPDTNFYFVIGSDLLETIDTWAQSEKLLNENNFIIFNRKGYQIDCEKKQRKLTLPKSYYLSKLIPPEISSSFVKKTLEDPTLSPEERLKRVEHLLEESTIESLKKLKYL